MCACLQRAGRRAVSEPYYSQRARSVCVSLSAFFIIMRPCSLGGGRILRPTLSVRPSVCLTVRPVVVFVYFFTVEPSNERTSKIEKLLFSLMGQRHVCTFRHAQRAAYRTAISAAQTYYGLFACVRMCVCVVPV